MRKLILRITAISQLVAGIGLHGACVPSVDAAEAESCCSCSQIPKLPKQSQALAVKVTPEMEQLVQKACGYLSDHQERAQALLAIGDAKTIDQTLFLAALEEVAQVFATQNLTQTEYDQLHGIFKSCCDQFESGEMCVEPVRGAAAASILPVVAALSLARAQTRWPLGTSYNIGDGKLIVNNTDLTTTDNVTIKRSGTTPHSLTFEDGASPGNTISLIAPTSVPTANYTLTLPTSGGTAGQVLQTSGGTSAALSWTSAVTTCSNTWITTGNTGTANPATLGTNDAAGINVVTNGATRMTFASNSGDVTVGTSGVTSQITLGQNLTGGDKILIGSRGSQPTAAAGDTWIGYNNSNTSSATAIHIGENTGASPGSTTTAIGSATSSGQTTTYIGYTGSTGPTTTHIGFTDSTGATLINLCTGPGGGSRSIVLGDTANVYKVDSTAANRFLHTGSSVSTGNLFLGTGAGTLGLSAALNNTGVGKGACGNLVNGAATHDNTALGLSALLGAGSAGGNCLGNTAIGSNALSGIKNGDNNTAIGYLAGSSYPNGETNNICIGANVTGTAAENNIIRLGLPGTHLKCYIGGIFGITAGGVGVTRYATSVAADGQIGTDGPVNFRDNLLIGDTAIVKKGTLGAEVNFLTTAGGVSSNNLFLGRNANNLASPGTNNTGIGANALAGGSLSGTQNTGIGANALGSVTSGLQNTAVGDGAAASLLGGQQNVAVGQVAGLSLTTGLANTLIGYRAGIGYTGSESTNTCLGSNVDGKAGDSNCIRIGFGVANTGGLTNSNACFIDNITGVTSSPGGTTVLINSQGQLSNPPSSERFKENIELITEDETRFMQLEGVAFNYKGNTEKQYGVIAERARTPYPEMVVFDEDGLPYAFQYQKLDGIFIHEIQRAHLNHQAVNTRVTTIEGQQCDTRIAALEGKNLDTRLTTIEGENLGTRLTTLEGKDLDTRLATIEGQNLDARVRALENPTVSETRFKALEQKAAELEQQLSAERSLVAQLLEVVKKSLAKAGLETEL